MEFGEFLAKLRKERGILQKELANHLNVTVATISNYEKGVHSPDIYTLVQIADFFDVSTDYLLQRTECKTALNTLNARLSANYTFNDLLNLALDLDRHNRMALADYSELLSMRNSLTHNRRRSQRH